MFTTIPDAFLNFLLALQDGRQRRLSIVLKHDRGTEGKDHFKRRIRAYITLLKTDAYQQFFVGSQCLTLMREWTSQELAVSNEPVAIGLTFLFTNLQPPLVSRHMLLEPCWSTQYDNSSQPLPLLVEG